MKRFSNRVLAVYHPSKYRDSNLVCPIFRILVVSVKKTAILTIGSADKSFPQIIVTLIPCALY